jgi:hypothetical protein
MMTKLFLRQKNTPVPEDAMTNKFLENANKRLRSEILDGKILKYVTPAKLSNSCDRIGAEEARPYCLSLWLKDIG